MRALTYTLIVVVTLLTILSAAATFYSSVLAQNYQVEGVWIEVYEDSSAYAWFVYDNQEYEIDLDTSNYEDVLLIIADEIGVTLDELDPAFIDYFDYAFTEASNPTYE